MNDIIRMKGGKLVLRLRDDKYQARISLGSGKYIWRGLKTDRLEVAKLLAIKFLPMYRFKLNIIRARPAFSNEELNVLLDRIESRIDEAKNDVWRYTRILLRNYVHVLVNSGMRVGEANNLKRRDVTAFRDAVDAIRRGIPIYEISRNMGTSMEMLQKYYANHALTATTATRLGN